MISSEEIVRKLEVNRTNKPRGDILTAKYLISHGKLKEFPYEKFGSISSSGIPYHLGAGERGVEFDLKSAEVLVLLIPQPECFNVLFIKRSDSLSTHAGQVAFPGGKVEDIDLELSDAAKRETEEEVGLAPNDIRILGSLDKYLTITGYEIIPFVGLISSPMHFNPDPNEVSDIFEVPLPFLLDKSNHQKVCRNVNGFSRAFFAIEYDKYYIWGATAGIVVNLSEVLNS
ncbi:MAG: CoA pyrophosphatase [Pseudomonadota bacterium]|nr:CoA pyrophosphatase [Pseudomonadota bacterium]